ncbi:MAG: hypothetical protein ACREMX_09590 [Gemmatimonadales bacterium]
MRISLGAIPFFLAACGSSTEPFTENLDITVCAPSGGPFTPDIDNPYFPLSVGTQLTLEGVEDGAAIRLVITVFDETENVAGVPARVVEERETQDGELVEVSRNFFVQASDGTVCYYGEDVDVYEGGAVVDHPGQWRAGVNGAVPGIFMPASPAAGQAFRQEVAAGVAEDRVEITAEGESVTVPFGTFSNTIRFRETTPLEPGVVSLKVYARDVGPIVDNVVELISRTP